MIHLTLPPVACGGILTLLFLTHGFAYIWGLVKGSDHESH